MSFNGISLYIWLAIIVWAGIIICVVILRKQKRDREEQKAVRSEGKAEMPEVRSAPAQSRQTESAKTSPSEDTIDLTKVLNEEELRLLSTDLGIIIGKVNDSQQKMVVSIVKDMVESTGHIGRPMLDLCIAAVQDTVDSMASVFGLSMGGHNALLEKLKNLRQ